MRALQTLNVAVQEMVESAHSRRAAVTLLLYLAVSLLTMNGLISGLQRVETEVRDLLSLPASAREGAVTDAVWRSPRFRQMVRGALRDDSAALDLFASHPLAVAYGWLALLYTPLLVMLVTPARLSEEIGNGAVRYPAARISRSTWLAGKFTGQFAVTVAAILMGAAGAWIVARLRMSAADGGAVALGLLWAALRTSVYAAAFVGLGCGLAMWTRSPGRATAAAVVTLMLLTATAGLVLWLDRRGMAGAAHALRTLLPQTYRLDLWRLSAPRVIAACAALFAIAGAGLAAGAVRLERRDL